MAAERLLIMVVFVGRIYCEFDDPEQFKEYYVRSPLSAACCTSAAVATPNCPVPAARSATSACLGDSLTVADRGIGRMDLG